MDENENSSETAPDSLTSDAKRDRRAFGVISLTFAMVAFLLAAMSPWVAPAFEPEHREIEDRAVDVVVAFKEKLAARLKGAAPPAKQVWDSKSVNWYPAAAVAIGGLAVCVGVVGFVRGEDQRINLSAILLAAAAILLQFFLLVAAALLFILLIGVILGALGFTP